jgi:hypothetical protein
VLSARSAGLDEALLQSLASAKDAYTGIAGRKAVLLRKRLDCRASHVNCLQSFRILLFERTCQARNTGADFRFDLRFRSGVRLKLARERFDRTPGGVTSPKAIDRGVSERPIEPRDKAFIGRNLIRPVHDFDERVLKNVFSQLAIVHTALEIPQKGSVVLQENLDRRSRIVSERFGRVHRRQYTGRCEV